MYARISPRSHTLYGNELRRLCLCVYARVRDSMKAFPVGDWERDDEIIYAAFLRHQSMVFFKPCLNSTSAVKPKACFALSVSKQRRG